MRRLWYLIRRFLGLLPAPRWEDGVVSTDPRYAALYAQTVARIAAKYPDKVQSPDFRVTVRIYDRWPENDGRIHYGKVLAPNVIKGDTGGTLCLNAAFATSSDGIVHECGHAITGESGHPAWLYKPENNFLYLNV